MKRCCVCEQEKPVEDFSKSKQAAPSNGRRSNCKECCDAAARDYYRREGRLKKLAKKYGIEPQDYGEMYVKQDGRCAICFKEFDVLFVDHCHDTDKIRGLLCSNCNSALGLLGDSLKNLESASKYLGKHT